MSRDLAQIRAERKSMHPDDRGFIHGNIEAVPAPADSENYVIVKKKEQPQEKQQQQNQDQTEKKEQ